MNDRRCADHSRDLDEAMRGSASTIRSWLLLEQPGAWPRVALDSRHLGRDVVTALSRKANAHGVRVVLIRRPGRPTRVVGDTIACYLAHARRVDPWIARMDLPDVRAVLDVDLASVVAGDVPDGAQLDGPIFCVCTHGSHDPCCATRGRAVAAAMVTAFPYQTWEISHIGGDRFAANVVCFPHALYLGRVEPETATDVATAYANGHITLANLRGRACDAPAVQAADSYLRESLGRTAIDAIRVLTRHRDATLETVRFAVRDPADSAAAAAVMVVRLRSGTSDPARALTCRASGEGEPPTYELVDIAPESDDRP